MIGLVIVVQTVQPGTVGRLGRRRPSGPPIPLAILAGSQTLTMLTGGIDLSVGTVATMAAFVNGDPSRHQDPIIAILLSLVPRRRRPRDRHRRRMFRVHPLIMTLAVGLVVAAFRGLPARVLGTARRCPGAIRGSARRRRSDFLPNSLFLFVPLAA